MCRVFVVLETLLVEKILLLELESEIGGCRSESLTFLTSRAPAAMLSVPEAA